MTPFAPRLFRPFNPKPMKKSLPFLVMLITALGLNLNAQEVVIEEVYDDTVIPTHGQNLRHYGHFYFGLGFPVADVDKTAETKKGLSASFDFGYRYKRKVFEYWAVGFDLHYSLQGYRLKDDEIDGQEFKRRSYLVNNLNLAVYQRINLNRRGNSIGKYIDLGGYGAWNFTTTHQLRRKGEGDETFKWIDIRETGLDYLEPIQYGLQGRLGSGRYALTARYRLSDLVKAGNVVELGELPRLILGLEIGFF